MRFTLDLTKAVLPDIGVLRRERDESLVRKPGSECVIVGGVDVRVRHITRPSLQPVLANDNRTLLSWPDILRHQKDAIGENTGPNVQRDLVSPELRFIENEPGAWICRHTRIGNPSDYLVPDVIAHWLGCGL